MKVPVIRNVLEANEQLAEKNKALFKQHGLLVLNLMSSPGAGKTSLLERTIQALKDEFRVGVVEGDIQSTYDAERIGRTGVPVVQINTGGACHLDSNMIQEALRSLEIAEPGPFIHRERGQPGLPGRIQRRRGFQGHDPERDRGGR